jgi:D-3-phosphoglycerate dehydrogenase
VEKIPLFSQSDLISLHVPLTPATRNLINKDTLQHFRKESFLFNYSRGDIVHEGDLYDALRSGSLAGAAIDVFNEEPYHGPLIELDQVLLTPHMGSCSFDCRAKMELQATEDLIRFFKGQKLENEVPVEEYLYQQET